jgi:hypothetical protein
MHYPLPLCPPRVMQSMFGFGGPAGAIEVVVADSGRKKRMPARAPAAGSEGPPSPLIIFSTGDNVEGEVKVAVPGGKRLEHTGVKIELKGILGTCLVRRSGLGRGRGKRTWPVCRSKHVPPVFVVCHGAASACVYLRCGRAAW